MLKKEAVVRTTHQNTLVLVNSGSPRYSEAVQIILPYLEHFGVPYTALDLMSTPLPHDVSPYSLIIAAHSQLDPSETRLSTHAHQRLLRAICDGTGLVSFDPTLSASLGFGHVPHDQERNTEWIDFAELPHYITANHELGERVSFVGQLALPEIFSVDATTLLSAGDQPLLAVNQLEAGRVANWATCQWALTSVLGPLAGLDDVLWRSMVWAARKPFALRGLPPFLTMRVDDVTGTGSLWNQSPMSWVRTANRYGFKPWLGLFLHNLTDEGIEEVRELVDSGMATAFPHAFGRPPRADTIGLSYAEDAPPLRSSTYDEFIYFDHEHGQAWSDEEAARGLAVVDDWYARHAPLSMSHVALGHWYEMGSNVMAHLQDVWGIEFLCKVQDADAPLQAQVPWLVSGPFRRHEEPGACHFNTQQRSSRPVYYADFVNFGDRQFFNCVTEIRDDAGYEWAPDNDVTATVQRAVRQLRRALDSMALAVLFTHETDYIYKISPKVWDEEFAQIHRALNQYNPMHVTLDDGFRYVRATHTSRFADFDYDPLTRTLQATFTGVAGVPTKFYLFTESNATITSTLVDVAAFTGCEIVTLKLDGIS